MNRFNTRSQKGIVLITAYLALSMMSTLSLALSSQNLVVYRVSERTANQILAFHLAESAIDQAIVQLRDNPAYTSQNYTGFGQGGYDIRIETPDPVNRPTLRRIHGIGHTPNNLPVSYAYQNREVVAYVDFAPETEPGFGIFSESSIQISGSGGTDSYDSREGPYRSETARANGDMGTNSTRSGFVALSGSAAIRGDAVVGPGGNPAQVIRTSGHAVVQGSRSAASRLRPLDPVTLPGGLTNLGSLTVKGGDVLTLGGGTYWFSEIHVSGHSRIQFTGPATVYVSGNVSLSGASGASSVKTNDGIPANLKLNIQGTDVKINGSSEIHAVIHAPKADFHLTGTSEVFGSVAANTIQQSGQARVHYDEALAGDSRSVRSRQSTLVAWQEN